MNEYDEIKKLYDNYELYNNEFANYEDDFSFWKYWIKKIKPNNVLEIGIGNGRLIKLLSPMVNRYDGVEFSKKIIDDFKKKNKKYNGIIYNQDMKNININNIYDLIIIPFNTFVYLYNLNDILNFFQGIKSISNEKTIIIIDIFNPSLDDLKDVNKYKLCGQFDIDKDNYKLYEKHHYNPLNQIIIYYKKYVNNGKKIELSLPVRVFFHQEIMNIIKLNGFDTINELGDYNNEEYSCNSRKQILFLKKRCK